MRLLTDATASLREHREIHGPMRLGSRASLLDAVSDSGLLGRGGAGFPTGRKMRTVAAGRRTVVLANACEGEPGSSKDTVLLTHHPHLVLDGLLAAAHAIRADEIHLAVHAGSTALPALERALAERDLPVAVHEVPARYVASEE